MNTIFSRQVLLSQRIVFLSLLLVSVSIKANVTCIGNDYEQQMPVSNVDLPTVKIVDVPQSIHLNKTISLKAEATVDVDKKGSAFFVWCVESGTLKYDQNYPDYRVVNFTPSILPTDKTLDIGVQVGDGLGYVNTKRMTVNVAELSIPAIATIPNKTILLNSPFLLNVSSFVTPNGNDITGYQQIGTLPNGITFNTTSGTFSGTPTELGIFTPIVIRVGYGMGQWTTAVYFKITVTENDIPPTLIGNIQDQIIEKDDSFALNTAAYFAETNGDSITNYSLVGSTPNGINFENSSGMLAGTPTQTGTFSLSIQAQDNDGMSEENSFSIIVQASSEQERPPQIVNIPEQQGALGVLFKFESAPYVRQTNGDSIIQYSTSGTPPNGILFYSSTGTFSGVPTEKGKFYVSVKAKDNDGWSNWQNIPIKIDRRDIEEGSIQVAAGENHSLAIVNGDVYAWGDNGAGQLGDGGMSNRSRVPIKVDGLSDIIAISAGERYSLALNSSGEIYAWGENQNGRLGIGSQTDQDTPVKLDDISNVKAISAGAGHVLALLSDGDVYAWGDNSYGQLGIGDVVREKHSPQQITDLSDIVEISAGYDFSLALDSDGQVHAWGNNEESQLGDGYQNDKEYYPIETDISDVKTIAAGYYHALAIKNDNTVWGWGYNDWGAIGVGLNTYYDYPTQITALDPEEVPGSNNSIHGIDGGENFSFGFANNGFTWGWGVNVYGHLGNGETKNKEWFPIRVDIRRVMEISAGKDHTLAVKKDGTIWAWGYNHKGQLGDDTYDQKTSPTKIDVFELVPSIASIPNQAINQGEYFVLNVNDYVIKTNDDDIINYRGYSDLDEIDFDRATGVFSGVITTVGEVGEFELSTEVKDDDGWSDEIAFTITVIETQTAPIMGSILNQTALEGSTFALNLANFVTQTNNDSISLYNLTGNLPVGVQLNTNTGFISGIPNQSGIFGPFTVKAYDNDGWSNTMSFNLTVNEPQTPPSILSVSDYTFEEESHLSLNLSSFVLETNSDPIEEYEINGNLPTGVQLNTSTGLLSGNPTEVGEFSLTFRAKDNDGWSSYEGFVILVTEKPQSPTDSDGDGVPDSQDAFPNDATESVDTDGNGTGNNADPDDDGDGMPDDYENQYAFLNPLDPSDASADQDGDGLTNLDEYQQEKNPAIADNPENGDNPVISSQIKVLSAGDYHTCALRTDGTIICWGDNQYGQATPPTGIFTQLTARGQHHCALRTNGTITCWGNNERGQATPPSGTFTQISAGSEHTCALRTNNTISCWGYNYYEQATPPSGTFTQISAGGYHNCALRVNGTVVCWGYNAEGQTNSPSGTFTKVYVGGYHSCGLRTDETITCWGNDDYGLLTPPSGTFTQISGGGFFNCALRTDGTVACWGINSADGRTTAPSGTFTHIDAGGGHTCGLHTNGTVICWGFNNHGQTTLPNELQVQLPDHNIPIFIDSGQELITINGNGKGVALGDIDGDGDLDAFVANYGTLGSEWSVDGQPNKVWLNDGSGTFIDSGQNLGNSYSFGIALGDVDDDGDLDAFVANTIQQPNKVWLNNGSGIFTDSGQNLGNSYSFGVALSDVDNDGDIDAVVANAMGRANKVWLNNGSGIFKDSGQNLGNSSSRKVALGDIDGDGDLDIAVANDGQPNKVWLNNGSGRFSDSRQNLGNSDSWGIALGDVDGDRDLDIIVANTDDPSKVWLNNGSGIFTDSGQIIDNSKNTVGIAVSDLDGDGDLDSFIIDLQGSYEVWLNNGSGTFTDTEQNLGNSSGWGIALGDVDGDSDFDAFVVNYGANKVWLNQFKGKTEKTDDVAVTMNLDKNSGNFQIMPTDTSVNLSSSITVKIDGRPVEVDWQTDGLHFNLYEALGLTFDTFEQPVEIDIRAANGEAIFRGYYPFVDVGPYLWYTKPVMVLWKAGILDSNSDNQNRLGPFEAATREEFVTVLTLALEENQAVDSMFRRRHSEAFPKPSAKPYNDIEVDRWSAPYIQYAKDRGLIQGCGDGNNFCPTAPMIRADAAGATVLTFDGETLTAFENGEQQPEQLFKDVKDANQEYYPYVYTVQAKEWLHGYSDNTFKPEQAITHAEGAKLISLAASGPMVNVDQGEPEPTVAAVFPLKTIINEPTTFIVEAVNLPDSTVFWIQHCQPIEIIAKGAEQWQFRCTPTAIGTKRGHIKDQKGGTELFTFTVKISLPDPVVASVSPLTTTQGELTVFTIVGSDLPDGIALFIENCANLTALGGTNTQQQFSCTPTAIGNKRGIVKDKLGGVDIYNFTVNVETPPMTVTSVSPTTATFNQATVFTVKGNHLTESTTLSIEGCNNLTALSGGTVTQRQFRCVPTSIGNKQSVVKDKPAGTEIFNFTINMLLPPPTVDSLSPLTATLNQSTVFTVTGNYLPDSTAFWIDQCKSVTLLSNGTPTQRQFRCTPSWTVGTKQGVVKDKSGGNVLLDFTIQVLPPPPTVSSVSPLTVTFNQSTVFTVKGDYLTDGVALAINECTKLSVLSRTATQLQFSCVPSSTGAKQGTVKIDGKTLFDFKVNVLPPPPIVSSVLPLTATLNQSTVFTVKGDYLTDGVALAIDGCTNLTALTGTATQLQFSCVPSSTGTKQATVKADGKTLFNFKVNVLPPPPTVSSVSPLTATLDQSTVFTVKGNHLNESTTLSIEGCINLTALSGGTATQQQFRCVPTATGAKQGTVKADGKTLFNFTVNVLPPPPVVSSVSPTTATLNQSTVFTVKGNHLTDAVVLAIDGCAKTTALSRTATQQQFRCVPSSIGAKQATVKLNGKTLFNFTVNVLPLLACVPKIVYAGVESTSSDGTVEKGQSITHKWKVRNTSTCDAVNYRLTAYEARRNGRTYSNSKLNGIYPAFTLKAGQTGWIEAKFTLQDSGDFKIWVDIINEKGKPLLALSGGRLWTEFRVIQENMPTVFYVSPLTATVNQSTVFTVKGNYLTDNIGLSISGCTTITALEGGTATQRRFRCVPTATGAKQATVKADGKTLFNFTVNVLPLPACVPKIVYAGVESTSSDGTVEKGQSITHKWKVRNTSTCDAVNYRLTAYEARRNGRTYSNSKLNGIYPAFTLKAGQTGWIEAKFTLQDSGDFKIWVDIINEKGKPLLALSGGRLWTEFKVIPDNSTVFEVSPLTANFYESTVFTIRGNNLPASTAFWIAECASLTNLGGTATQWQFRCTPSYSKGVKEGVVKDKPGGTLLHSFTVNVQW